MAEKQPTIQNFIASMNRSGGFARTSKYAVIITPPASLSRLAAERNTGGGAQFREEITNTNAANMQTLNSQVGRQINLHCNTVSMPGHDLQAQDQQHGSAPGRQIVQSHDYAGFIDASFYLDVHMRERHFFEQWQKMAVNTNTHKANYYDDYIGTMEIYQLDGDGEITYGIKATEVYPSTIAGIEYAYANTNQIAIQAVQFQYRQWYNLTSDDIAGYSKRLVLSNERNSDNAVTRVASDLAQSALKNLGIEKSIAFEREKKRLEQLRKPEISKASSLSGTSLFSSQKAEQKRQEQLRKPEIDRQDSSRRAGIKEAKRQEQLRSTTSN